MGGYEVAPDVCPPNYAIVGFTNQANGELCCLQGRCDSCSKRFDQCDPPKPTPLSAIPQTTLSDSTTSDSITFTTTAATTKTKSTSKSAA